MEPIQAKPVHQKEFTERVEDFLLENYKALIAVFVVIVVAAGGYATMQSISASNEKKAQDELFAITSELDKKVADLNEAAQKDSKAKDPKAKKDAKADLMETLKEPVKTPETLAKDLGPQVQKLEDFLKSNNDRKAGFIAAMALSDLYLDYQEPKKAVEILKPIADKPSKDDLFYGLINSQYALALSNSNNCQEAVDVYDNILKSKDQKHIHAQAMLRKGVCLMTLQKYDQAKDVFQEARTEYPDSMSGRSAESFERYLALKKGQAK